MKSVASRIAHRLAKEVKRVRKPALAKEVARNDNRAFLRTGRFGQFDIAFRPDTADESVLEHSFDSDIFFPPVHEYQPSDNDVIIDIGAHIGTFSLLAASRNSSITVHAIEACRETFDFLRINIALNKADRIKPHHLALSDKKGTCRLHYDSGNWGHSIVSELSSDGETTTTDTLANFFGANGISHCNFMKLNCEGAEFPILTSAPVDVLRKVETFLVLYHSDMWQSHSQSDLAEMFHNAGFATRILNDYVTETRDRGWLVASRR